MLPDEELEDHRDRELGRPMPESLGELIESLRTLLCATLTPSLLTTFQLKGINCSLLCVAMEPAFIKDLPYGRLKSNRLPQIALGVSCYGEHVVLGAPFS